MDETRTKLTKKVITVRIPAELHRLLKKEAKEKDVSLNKLCVKKLGEDKNAEE